MNWSSEQIMGFGENTNQSVHLDCTRCQWSFCNSSPVPVEKKLNKNKKNVKSE